MKSDLVKQAEQEAREACEGLGWTEKEIQSFVDLHIEGEMRRDEEKAKELARPKRDTRLRNALIHIAVDPYRRAEDAFPAFNRRPKSDFEMEVSRWDDKRNRGET